MNKCHTCTESSKLSLLIKHAHTPKTTYVTYVTEREGRKERALLPPHP